MITIILSLIQDQATPAAVPHFQTNDFLTLGTLGTLAGSSGIVYFICSSVQNVFNWNPKWLALLLSILISLIVAAATPSEIAAWIKYVIAFLNGFLIFATATGVNIMRATNDPKAGGAGRLDNRVDLNQPAMPVKRTFSTSWF